MDKRFLGKGLVLRKWQKNLPGWSYAYFECALCGYCATGVYNMMQHLDKSHPETKKDSI